MLAILDENLSHLDDRTFVSEDATLGSLRVICMYAFHRRSEEHAEVSDENAGAEEEKKRKEEISGCFQSLFLPIGTVRVC